jgi:hypothetical protein
MQATPPVPEMQPQNQSFAVLSVKCRNHSGNVANDILAQTTCMKVISAPNPQTLPKAQCQKTNEYGQTAF